MSPPPTPAVSMDPAKAITAGQHPAKRSSPDPAILRASLASLQDEAGQNKQDMPENQQEASSPHRLEETHVCDEQHGGWTPSSPADVISQVSQGGLACG